MHVGLLTALTFTSLPEASLQPRGAVECSLHVVFSLQYYSTEVWAEGVNHSDERDPNLLWNTERHRVMLVDFDRATLRPTLKHKQVMQLPGNKRKQPVYDVGVHGGRHSSLQSESRIYYYDHRVYIVHLTLTSWGGESLHEAS